MTNNKQNQRSYDIKEFRTINLAEHILLSVQKITKEYSQHSILHDIRITNPIKSGKHLELGNIKVPNHRIAYDEGINNKKLKKILKKQYNSENSEVYRILLHVEFNFLTYVFNSIQGTSAITDTEHYERRLAKISQEYYDDNKHENLIIDLDSYA